MRVHATVRLHRLNHSHEKEIHMIFELLQRHPGPRGQRAVLVLSCLLLTLSLALGQAAAGLTAAGDAAATHAAALRAQVAAAGWVTVRVDLHASEQTAAAPVVEDDLEQTAQDLLFALPAGSYDTVERAAGSDSLTLRVDAAGLDALLGSPWTVSLAAADTPEMQRLAAGGWLLASGIAWLSRPTAASGPGDTIG
jgi:hypothetical protein